MATEPTAGLRRWLRSGIVVVLAVKLAALLPLVALAVGGGDAKGQSGAPGAAAPAAGPGAPSAAAAGFATAAPKSSPPPPPVAHATRIPGDGPSAAFDAESRGVRELVEVLGKRDEELERRDAELARREAAIAAAAKDLNEKIVHLESLTGSAPPAVAAASPGAVPAAAGSVGAAPTSPPQAGAPAGAAAAGSPMEELGKIYGAMKAEEAAPLFDRLDDATVLRIFQNMKQKQISAVLPLMKPEKAVTLTELLGGRLPPAAERRAAADTRATTR